MSHSYAVPRAVELDAVEYSFTRLLHERQASELIIKSDGLASYQPINGDHEILGQLAERLPPLSLHPFRIIARGFRLRFELVYDGHDHDGDMKGAIQKIMAEMGAICTIGQLHEPVYSSVKGLHI